MQLQRALTCNLSVMLPAAKYTGRWIWGWETKHIMECTVWQTSFGDATKWKYWNYCLSTSGRKKCIKGGKYIATCKISASQCHNLASPMSSWLCCLQVGIRVLSLHTAQNMDFGEEWKADAKYVMIHFTFICSFCPLFFGSQWLARSATHCDKL